MTTAPNPSGVSGLSPQEETTWASLAHWLGIILGFIGPLIALLVQGEKSPRVKAAATESLNFQITLLLGYIISFILTVVLIGALLWFVVLALQVIFPLLGGLAEQKGEAYKYPFALRLIK